MPKRRAKASEKTGATNVTQLRPGPEERDSEPSAGRRLRPPRMRSKPRKQRPHVPYAFMCGLFAALIVAFLTECVVAAAWLSDPKSTASWNDAFGAGIAIWALAQRAHVTSGGATVVFAPLLLSLLSVFVASLMARLAMPKQRLRVEDLRLVFLAFIGGYIVAAQILGMLASLGSVSLAWWSLFVGPTIVAGLGLAATLWRHRDRSPELAAWDRSMNRTAPLLFRRSLRAALRGMALFGVLSFAQIVILIAWHGGRMWTVQQQLHPGVAGGILLIAGQILALPNFLSYAAAWSSGSAVGFGAVSIGHGGMTTGLLPMIPAFGALPNGGVHSWTWCALALPIVVGGFIGWEAADALSRLSSIRSKMTVAASAAGVTTVFSWVLWWASSASVSTGLLGFVGPNWVGYLALPALLVIPAMLVSATRHWWVNHR